MASTVKAEWNGASAPAASPSAAVIGRQQAEFQFPDIPVGRKPLPFELMAALALAIGLVVFLLDILLPLGIAGGVPYVAMIIVGWWFPKSRHVFLLAGLASGLTLAATELSPSGADLWIVIVNRGYALFAIWTTAAFVVVAKSATTLASNRELRHRMIVDSAADGIITINATGTIETFNKGAAQIFGYAAAEVLGKNVKILMPDPFRSEHDGYLERYHKTGKAKILGIGREVEGRRKDGMVFPMYLAISGAEMPEGRIFTGIVRDLTVQKDAEEALHQANQELEAFAYSVSHDLRAPLRAMSGFSEALIEDYGDQVDAAARDYLNRINGAAGKMGGLIDDMLKLSRVSRANPEFERIDLSEMADEIVTGLAAENPERGVEVTVRDGVEAYCDHNLIRIALENLIGNAWKFTANVPGAAIEFGYVIQESGTRAYFVRDNGTGFDMRYADKLFRPFERLHSSAEYDGSGIGLANVSRVIARHGGTIWAESDLGKGATFYFTLAARERKQ